MISDLSYQLQLSPGGKNVTSNMESCGRMTLLSVSYGHCAYSVVNNRQIVGTEQEGNPIQKLSEVIVEWESPLPLQSKGDVIVGYTDQSIELRSGDSVISLLLIILTVFLLIWGES